MTDCWNLDTHARPNFKDILRRLDKISRSYFVDTPNDSFHSMQDNWKIEIEAMLDDLKSKEKELRCREEELTQAMVQQKMQEEALRRREQELLDREIEVLGR